MKKIVFALGIFLTTSSMFGNNQPYHINLSTGLNVFDDAEYLEDSAVYGVSATFYEKETLSYALQLGYERLTGVPYEGIRLSTDINRYSVNMLVDGEEELNVTPYLLVGGGYEQFSSLYEEYHDTKNQAFVNLGLGFKYRLSDYVNITLESKAIGQMDSKKLDYVTKVGLDVMFGGASTSKPMLLSGLEERKDVVREKKSLQKPKVLQPKVLQAKKKKWITPEVVEAMFSEKKETPSLPKEAEKEKSVMQMQAHLKALKEQMQASEEKLDQKLARLEALLVQKEREKALALQREKKKLLLEREKRLAFLEAEAKKRHAQKIAKLQAQKRARVKKLEAQAKAKREREAALQRAALRKAKRLEEEKRALKAKKEKEAALAAKFKEEQEKTDILHIANGMVVFAD